MSSLSTIEKSILEKLFQMWSWYVINFSDRTMESFFADNGIDIYADEYNCSSGSKANRMRGFWRTADNSTVSESILKLLEYIENEILLWSLQEEHYPKPLIEKCREIAIKLSQTPSEDSSREEDEFLKKSFVDTEKKIQSLGWGNFDVLKQRTQEIEKCLRNDIPLWAIFLIGSTLEGILLDQAFQDTQAFCAATSAPKKKWQVIDLNLWTLWSLIDVAHELKFVWLNTKKFSHALRDFRNFIHPREQVKLKFNPDLHTASICFQVLKSAIDDIQKSKITP